MNTNLSLKWNLFFNDANHPLCDSLNKETINVFKLINKKYKNKQINLKILDIGCGAGNDLVNIHNNLDNKNTELNGLDFSKKAILVAKERSKNKEINYIQASIKLMPFKKEYFDIIYTFSLFHCLKNKDISNLLKDINYLLKKQGVCFIKTRSKKDFLYKIKILSNNVMKDELVHSFFSSVEFKNLLGCFFKKVIIKENTFIDNSHDKPHVHSFLIAKCYK